ncbi:NAD(P)/FAD-dependent oxidoreductase [Halococcus agarilyticus]|uniref:NAD(P)/FAD-dependent oxidoreductase n=1 Tax=Halococcus agarilyticus TaxID=1232219 RepID=UPI0006782F60|nr:NAD(P)/FAD-dependent oxidoreductase [Halococcus agarilyticus]
MSTTGPGDETDHDVVIVGGGPAGCSAGVFTARHGLDVVVFDRGRSSIQRCAHLENYLGFPTGVDIGTFYELMHAHAEEAGCEIVPNLVESVERAGEGFVVEPQEGECVTAARVVAAARYDGEYLRPLGGDAMFETHEHDGEEHEHFDRSYAESDGTTPIEGLYVASPSEESDRQAIIAAGRGGRVGLAVLRDVRHERGHSEATAERYDWMRRKTELDGEWRDRERWREWLDDELPDDPDVSEERRVELREREVDLLFEAYLTDEEIDARAEAGQRALLEHLDDELVLERAREIETNHQPSEVSP